MTECPWPDKSRFDTFADANKVIASMYRQGRGNPDLNAYKCPAGHVHIGHDPVHFSRRIKTALRTEKPKRGKRNKR